MKELDWFIDRIGKTICITPKKVKHGNPNRLSHLAEESHKIADVADANMLFDRQNLCNYSEVVAPKATASI